MEPWGAERATQQGERQAAYLERGVVQDTVGGLLPRRQIDSLSAQQAV